jgi:hypothetical protein
MATRVNPPDAVKALTKYVQGGPQLWVSKTLYNKGKISTARLWDEYKRDRSVKVKSNGEPCTDIIRSKTFLKEHVLPCMLA